MNKPKQQGTAWETAFVRQAQDAGLAADRLPEGGMSDAGDVWINDTPNRNSIMANDIVVLAWKRLVKGQLASRRIADGAPAVIVMSTVDFFDLARVVSDQDYSFVVECKATERLNVTRALYWAAMKLARWKLGKTA